MIPGIRRPQERRRAEGAAEWRVAELQPQMALQVDEVPKRRGAEGAGEGGGGHGYLFGDGQFGMRLWMRLDELLACGLG